MLCIPGSFFRIGLFHIGAAYQVIQTDMVVLRQLDSQFQRQRPLSPLILGVERLVTNQVFRQLALFQICIFPQVANPQIHIHHQSKHTAGQIVLLTFWTICPKVIAEVIKMPDYKPLYFKLFAALADATEALEQHNYDTAAQILIQAQQDAEELYLTMED